MKDRNPSLILYIVAAVLAMVAKVFDDELLMLITKPMVVPAIFYYYLQAKTRNLNLAFSLALGLFFTADMITLLFGPGGILLVMACGMGSYLIMTYFAVTDMMVPKLTPFNGLAMLALLGSMGYWLYSILSLGIEAVNAHYSFYLSYGIVLALLVGISFFGILARTTAVSVNLSLMALFMLVSDLFYSIHKFAMPMPLLDHLNLVAQFASYFFMVRYFVARRPAEKETFRQWKQN